MCVLPCQPFLALQRTCFFCLPGTAKRRFSMRSSPPPGEGQEVEVPLGVSLACWGSSLCALHCPQWHLPGLCRVRVQHERCAPSLLGTLRSQGGAYASVGVLPGSRPLPTARHGALLGTATISFEVSRVENLTLAWGFCWGGLIPSFWYGKSHRCKTEPPSETTCPLSLRLTRERLKYSGPLSLSTCHVPGGFEGRG